MENPVRKIYKADNDCYTAELASDTVCAYSGASANKKSLNIHDDLLIHVRNGKYDSTRTDVYLHSI